MLHLQRKRKIQIMPDSPVGAAPRARLTATPQKKRPHEAGVKLLRQVSYRQETYRAVTPL